MSYVNLSYATVVRADLHIFSEYTHPSLSSIVDQHILARGGYLLLAPTSVITSALDIIVGLGAGIGAICTLGMHQPTLKVARYHLTSANQLAPRLYANLLRMIRPNARVNAGDFPEGDQETKDILKGKDGYLAAKVITPFRAFAKECYSSDNFLKRHVASRLTYALLAVACLVTRAVDGVIGIVAALFSLATLGQFRKLNIIAYRGLQAPGIISDLFYCVVKVINPYAGVRKVEPTYEEEHAAFYKFFLRQILNG